MSKQPLATFECIASFTPSSNPFTATLNLGLHELSWTFRDADNSTCRIPYSCIFGYQAPSETALDIEQDVEELIRTAVEGKQVIIHYLEFTMPNLNSAPRLAQACFLFHQRSDVKQFLTRAKELKVFPKQRRILFLINPKGGVGRAQTISNTIVKPMLEHSGLEVTEQYTEYARHAVDIAHKVDLNAFDALVVISGDGVLHEIINGLLSRPDWDQARRLPVGVISAGSGNAIATSLGTRNQYVAALAAIRGETAKMDIFSMSQLDRPRIYSMLLFSWGMTSDADLESERYRWLGHLRFEIAAFVRMIRLRRYPGKVYVLPPKDGDSSALPPTPPHSPDNTAPEIRHGSLLNPDQEPPKPWRLLDLPYYTFLLLLNHSSLTEDVFFTNEIRFNDGIMRLWYSCETRFWKILMPFVMDQQNGKLVERGLMTGIKCGGVLIVPGVEGNPNDPSTHEIVDQSVTSEAAKKQGIYTKPGFFDVDGEAMPTTRTLIEILPNFVKIIVPEWYNHPDDKEEKSVLGRVKADLILELSANKQGEVDRIWEAGKWLGVMALTVTAYAIFFSEEFQIWSGISRPAHVV
ncbi:Sphingosine kinase 1 [Podila verticillata]|nr:Sphingosine kinase 1 [Podila verticillata]